MTTFFLSQFIHILCGVLVSVQLDAVTRATGSPRIVQSAYQTGPSWLQGIRESLFEWSNEGRLTHLEFENRRRPVSPQTANHCLYRIKLQEKPPILRETSDGTSYSKIRLIFRPFAQLDKVICTSTLVRASTILSHGLTLFKQRSSSFGSLRVCLSSNLMGQAP
jgi:hypothetical protein